MTQVRGRVAVWWLLGTGLLLSAAEAERLRRHVDPPPLCLGSVILLRGTLCPARRQADPVPL